MGTTSDGFCRQHAILIATELEGNPIAERVIGGIDRALGKQPGTLIADLLNLFTGRSAPISPAPGPAFSPFSPFAPFSPFPGFTNPPAPGARAAPQPPPRSYPPPPRAPPPPRPRPPDPSELARMVMNFDPTEPLTVERVKDRKTQLAKVLHPDRKGGSAAQMAKVNAAADTLLAALAKRA